MAVFCGFRRGIDRLKLYVPTDDTETLFGVELVPKFKYFAVWFLSGPTSAAHACTHACIAFILSLERSGIEPKPSVSQRRDQVRAYLVAGDSSVSRRQYLPPHEENCIGRVSDSCNSHFEKETHLVLEFSFKLAPTVRPQPTFFDRENRLLARGLQL